MFGGNHTLVNEFVLVGFSDLSPQLQFFIFMFFLTVYLTTMLGNIIIIVIVILDPVLHTPMYFFLRILSFSEACYTSAVIPKLLVSLLAHGTRISFVGCATQMFVFFNMAVIECLLLGVMAFDRYEAICNPLHYTTVMNQRICNQLVAVSWLIGTLIPLVQTSVIFSLPFCGPNIIDHFFCDITPVVKLACTDTFINEIALFSTSCFVTVIPLMVIIFSYANIFYSILKMRSMVGKWKAFSTCASHLTSVFLFYGTGLLIYVRIDSKKSQNTDKSLALLYCILTPLLNPIIYSLRNKDVKKALTKLIRICYPLQGRVL